MISSFPYVSLGDNYNLGEGRRLFEETKDKNKVQQMVSFLDRRDCHTKCTSDKKFTFLFGKLLLCSRENVRSDNTGAKAVFGR